MAAMAIKSLSFSRGVRFMSSSIDPQFRQRPGVERGQDEAKIAPERRAVARAQPRHRDAVPARDAGLAGKILRAHRRDVTLLARHQQHGRNRAAAGRDRERGKFPVHPSPEAYRFGEHEPPADGHGPTSAKGARLAHVSPSGSAKNY